MSQPTRKLVKEWYAKAKEAGFKDIEYYDGTIKAGHARYPNSTDPIRILATMEYYNMASRFLHDHKFEKEIYRVIWEYHAEGISSRNIAKILRDVKIRTKIGKSHNSIAIIIRELSAKMKEMYLTK